MIHVKSLRQEYVGECEECKEGIFDGRYNVMRSESEEPANVRT